MNAKNILVVGIALNTVLATFADSFCCKVTSETQRGAKDPVRMAATGPGAKFGHIIETVLPAATTERPPGILDLETGRVLPQQDFEHFNFRADAIMAWVRTNGLDISCFTWSAGAACVTYNMSIVAVEKKSWDETTAMEVLSNPAVASGRRSPRRLLVLRHNGPDTYIFRTGEGTLGMLRIDGLSQDGRGVKIRYKLINSQSLSASM
jgi:hypothetical protein